MNIGLIIHSFTGHTLSVGEIIKERLIAKGHNAEIIRINAVNENPNNYRNFELANKPDIAKYDFVFLGAMVIGFNLSPVMKAYIKQIEGIKGKKVSCFLTEMFPKKWMGGNRSMKQMTSMLSEKGAEIVDSDIVNWMKKDRENIISEIADRLSKV